jgi:hypothetical protein
VANVVSASDAAEGRDPPCGDRGAELPEPLATLYLAELLVLATRQPLLAGLSSHQNEEHVMREMFWYALSERLTVQRFRASEPAEVKSIGGGLETSFEP